MKYGIIICVTGLLLFTATIVGHHSHLMARAEKIEAQIELIGTIRERNGWVDFLDNRMPGPHELQRVIRVCFDFEEHPKLDGFPFEQLSLFDELEDIRLDEWNGETVKGLGSLHKLKKAELSLGQIGDFGVRELSRLRTLESLSLSPEDATDGGMEWIGKVTSLKYLYLGAGSSSITDKGLRHLMPLVHLRLLSLYGNPITDDGLATMKSFHELEFLELTNTHVTGPGLVHLLGCPNLKSLWVRTPEIDDDDLKLIGKITPLTTLNLNQTSVTDAGLSHLSSLKNLETLYLGHTQVSEQGVTRLKQLLPRLKTVTLRL